MKKIAYLLTLVFVLSFNIIALAEEGGTHTGGRSCPENQVCDNPEDQTPPNQPTNNTANQTTGDSEDESDNPLDFITDYLKSLFGN